MAVSIYVGNLPWNVSEEEVSKLFSDYGEVLSVKIILDRETGRSRGFGFVEMEKPDADEAIRAINGTQFGGRTLRVNEAQPRQARPPRH